jgi:outer membrane biosynthesis protein TonB
LIMSETQVSENFSATAMDGSSAEWLAVALTTAFPQEDAQAKESEQAGCGECALDANLLQVVTPPAPVAFDALEEEVSRHRRLLVRGEWAIPITAVISIGGSIFYHLMLAGAFVVGSYFAVRAVENGMGMAGSRQSASAAGYIVMDGGLQQGASAQSSTDVLHEASPTPPSPAPSPPPIVQPAPNPTELAMNQLADPAAQPDLIGIPVGENALGQVKPRPPAPPVTAVLVAPSDVSTASVQSHAQGVPMSRAAEAAAFARGSGDQGNGTGDDDDPISWQRPGSGDNGAGKRHGSGNGYTSGAFREDPVFYDTPGLKLSLTTAVETNPTYEVLVRADGTLASVKLIKSSGQADIDELYRVQILHNWKAYAAYRGGQYVDAPTPVTIVLVQK